MDFGALWKTIQENAGYVLVILMVAAGILAVAFAAEKVLMKRQAFGVTCTKKVTVTGMMAALAFVLMMFDFSLPFAPGFYKLDFSEIPVLICAFALGPVSGVVCEFLKVLLHLVFRGTSTAFVGEFANFAVGCSFILPTAILYLSKKTLGMARISGVAGTLAITLFGSCFNAIYLLPAFSKLYGMPMDVLIGMGSEIFPWIGNSTFRFCLLCVAPLNLLKGSLVSLVVLLVYKPISRAIQNEFYTVVRTPETVKVAVGNSEKNESK